MDFSMFSFDSASLAAYTQLFLALSLIPISHYLLLLLLFSVVFLYNFLELHFVGDFFTGFRGCRISLTYHPSSYLYHGVVSKCRILHGRYLTTPWLASPHIQTVFLNFFGNPPVFSYRRQLFHASDGGTIALDWVMSSDVSGASSHRNETISKDDTTPIVVVIPGLTSDSASPYIKHLAFGTAKHGYDVVVSNHRGLGGVSVTSDCFYNAGWTEDTRVVINYLHKEYPKAPLFAIGTSIGANILVKYLGEDGESVPIAGAVAICSPWDLLIGDRFICRRLVQKFYDRALAIGLQGYAKMHEPHYSRLANWEGIKKSRSIRDFDSHATCLVGKFETVDTYYRRCSSSTYVGIVSVPLLCINALDDPVCTREAIPWDECRANKNVVLATSQHGGHLAFFEGITGSSLWWVRATNEFLRVLLSSPHMHVQKSGKSGSSWSLGSSIDQGPFVNVGGDGLVAAVSDDHVRERAKEDKARVEEKVEHDESEAAASVPEADQKPQKGETKPLEQETHRGGGAKPSEQPLQKVEEHHFTEGATRTGEKDLSGAAALRKCLNKLSRQSSRSVWLLVYVAVMTSWPLVGSALRYFRRGKRRNV